MEILFKYYMVQAIVTLVIAIPLLAGCIYLIITLDKNSEDRWYAITLSIFLTITIISAVAAIFLFASH